MIDSLRVWARDYKVDGFRFDLMGHHMLSNMLAIRAALDALTMEKDGVDGKAVILYGEGWNFGEVQNGARGRNAIQQNLGGSGIASFNDRLRDALRGGTPFSDPRTTGFASGLFLDKQAGASVERNWLESSDWVRLGLAGNLRNYTLDTLTGPRRGEQILYGGSAAGYALDPGETINYASAHDNETLFDKIQWAAPEGVSMQQRVRLNTLALSVVMLGQGIPFFHAGDDILRSKSLDANSFNSSDWFNAIDWTYQRNGWGKGLPPSSKPRWDDARPLLRNPALRPSRADIVFSRDVFRELLRIRKSSALFRLRTSDEIQQRVRFWNTGPEQTPGLIVLDIDGADAGDAYTRIVVAFNATGETVRLDVTVLKGATLILHPVQQQSVDRALAAAQFDPAGGTLSVPPLSTIVFVAQ